MLSRCHRALKPFRLSTGNSRCYHDAIAKFTTFDSNGKPASVETGIKIGDSNESYVYVKPEIGNAIRSAVDLQIGSSGCVTRKAGFETIPLQFNHDSLRFSHELIPLPRIDITRDLAPSPSNGRNISPATLWLHSNWHAITLDGTFDESFELMSRESALNLKGALELLKDT